MRKVLRGYAKVKDGNLVLIGTVPVPHAKRSLREWLDKRTFGQAVTLCRTYQGMAIQSLSE
jgi:hypothetical protein